MADGKQRYSAHDRAGAYQLPDIDTVDQARNQVARDAGHDKEQARRESRQPSREPALLDECSDEGCLGIEAKARRRHIHDEKASDDPPSGECLPAFALHCI